MEIIRTIRRALGPACQIMDILFPFPLPINIDIQPMNPSTQPIIPSTHPINPSAHQSIIPDMSLCMYVCMYVLMCLEHAHGCLGAWESGPVVPGPPPLGPWGVSQGLPGGGSGPKLQGPISVVDPSNLHKNLRRF